MKRTVAPSRGLGTAKHLSSGVFLVLLFVFSAWSLRVALVNFDTLSDLALGGVLNEALRAVIFVGPVFLYLRYVEKAPALVFLRISRPRTSFVWVLPLTGALFVIWYLLLDQIFGDRILAGIVPAVVLFAILSPATLVEEIFFRGFLLNKFWQTTGFWQANLASSLLFALVHFPGWFALGKAMPTVATDALGLIVFGMVFGWAMKKTGSLWTAYTLHTLNNLLVVVVLGP
jgi:uncharacterized protein